MTQYIDKSALVAEIERRKAINEKAYMQAFLNSNDNRDSFGYKVQEDIDILSFIDTLEVKETYLKKDFELTWEDIPKIFSISEQLKTSWWFRDNEQIKQIGTQVFWEEVLKRFKAQKGEEV